MFLMFLVHQTTAHHQSAPWKSKQWNTQWAYAPVEVDRELFVLMAILARSGIIIFIGIMQQKVQNSFFNAFLKHY